MLIKIMQTSFIIIFACVFIALCFDDVSNTVSRIVAAIGALSFMSLIVSVILFIWS
jgi:hypothetical protein